MNINGQLETFILHVRRLDEFTGCRDFRSVAVKMVETERHIMFLFVYRLIKLALLLPVATASVERVVSVMKIIKTERHNKMDDDWLKDLMICYNEKEIFKGFDDETIMRRFSSLEKSKDESFSDSSPHLVLIQYVHLIVYLPMPNIFIQL